MRCRLTCVAFLVAFHSVASVSQNQVPSSKAAYRFQQDSAEVRAQTELKGLEDKQKDVANESATLDIRQQELDGVVKYFTEELRKSVEARKVGEAAFGDAKSAKSALEAPLKKLHDKLSPAVCGGSVRAGKEENEYRTKEVEWLQQKSNTMAYELSQLNAHVHKLKSIPKMTQGTEIDERAILATLISDTARLQKDIDDKQKSIAALEKKRALLEEQKKEFEEHNNALQEIHKQVMIAQQINANLKQQKEELTAFTAAQSVLGQHQQEIQERLRVAQNATTGLEYTKAKFSGQLTWLNNEVAKLQWQAKHDFDTLQQRTALRKETHVMQARVDQLKENLQHMQPQQ